MRLISLSVFASLLLVAQSVSAQHLTCPDSLTSSHCDILEYSVNGDTVGVTYSATTTGAGTVQINSLGVVNYIPAREDVGRPLSIRVLVSDNVINASDTCRTVISITNHNPILRLPANDTVARGQTDATQVGVSDPDACDGAIFSLVSVTPQPLGSVTLDSSSGTITFAADDNDALGEDMDYQITVAVFDGQTSDTGTFTYTVLFRAPFVITLTQDNYQHIGEATQLAITYDGGTEPLAAFDFEFLFDSHALFITGVSPGSALQSAGWGALSTDTMTIIDTCRYFCPDALLRIHADNMSSAGLAASLSSSLPFTPGDTLVLINLRVGTDRTLGCQFIPLRWNWSDCNRNTLQSPQADTTYQSRRVFDYVGTTRDQQTGNRQELTGVNDSLPGVSGGMPLACDSVIQIPEMTAFRFVDFNNGAVRVLCEEPDPRGDLNLNGLSFEESDLQLYINYFTQGDTAFGSHLEGSVQASEINGDGRTLTVSDMAYMIRIIRGDALPIPKLTHDRDTVTFKQRGGDIITDMPLGALHLIFEGETTVTLEGKDSGEHEGDHGDSYIDNTTNIFLAGVLDDDENENESHGDEDNQDEDNEDENTGGHPHHSGMTLEIGIVDGNTHVLIYDIGDNQLHAGEILGDIHAKLLSADASDFKGQHVVVRFDFATDVGDNEEALQPESFALAQNYPNPFNPTTTIAFSLKRRADVELTIYNMLGQRIRTLMSESQSAGAHQIIWDGKNGSGSSVASGMYLYRLKVGAEISETRKMVLLK